MTKESKTDRNSPPSFLEQIARSRSKEHVERKRQLEEGPYHPSDELLRQYVLAELDKSDTEIVMEHVSLCGICARKALEIKWELKETEPMIDKIKRFMSNLSFPVLVQRPAFARGAEPDLEPSSYSPGMEIMLTLEAPADGYVTIFYGCEQTGEAKLIFPWTAKDNPRVSQGQKVKPVSGNVEGPPGRHWFKVFWTRERMSDPRKFNLDDEEQRKDGEKEFFDALCELNEDDWRTATLDYEVIER